MRKLTIDGQIRALDSMITVIANGDSLRKSERELSINDARQIRKTLVFVSNHQDAFRQLLSEKKPEAIGNG